MVKSTDTNRRAPVPFRTTTAAAPAQSALRLQIEDGIIYAVTKAAGVFWGVWGALEEAGTWLKATLWADSPDDLWAFENMICQTQAGFSTRAFLALERKRHLKKALRVGTWCLVVLAAYVVCLGGFLLLEASVLEQDGLWANSWQPWAAMFGGFLVVVGLFKARSQWWGRAWTRVRLYGRED